jgi:hypothetical protein
MPGGARLAGAILRAPLGDVDAVRARRRPRAELALGRAVADDEPEPRLAQGLVERAQAGEHEARARADGRP